MIRMALHEIVQMSDIPKTLKSSESDNSVLIDTILSRILSVSNPEKIILFGSYAQGNATKESDIDILVIMNSTLPRHKRSIPIYRILLDVRIPKDILVYTPEEIESWSFVSSAFVTSALQSGIVLYDKNQK